MSNVILDNAEKVIAAFGGIRPMAKKLGVAVTTIQGWKERGTIPIARLDEIKAAAEREGIHLMAAVQATGPSSAAADTPEKTPIGSSAQTADGASPETAATRKTSGSVPKSGTGPSGNETPTPKPEAAKSARAERVRPVPETGISAAEAAEHETEIIEEEIVEYDERGWRTRTLMFGFGFGLAVAVGFGGAWYLGAFNQTASLSDKDRSAWEARFSAANDARTKIETQLTKVERRLAASTKALATANASLAEMQKAAAGRTRALDGDRTQVSDLAKRVDALPTSAGDTGAIAKLADRLREIEKKLASASTQDGKTVETLTQQNARLQESLSATEKRLAALESRVRRLAPGGGYGAMVIAIGQLRDTALAGRAFKAELDRVRVLAKDYPEILKLTESLTTVASKGIASRTALVEGFGPAGVKMLSAATKNTEGDLADRTWGRLRSMVTIRRTGRTVTGTTPAALITRAENALTDGRLGEALILVGQLPAASRTAGQGWIDLATKRLQAETVLDRLQTAILKMVTGTGGSGTGAKQ